MRRWLVLAALVALLIPGLVLAQGSPPTTAVFPAVGDVTNPPQAGTLTKMTTTGTMQAATSSDTAVNLWVCIDGCGSGLLGQFAQAGLTTCLMDGTASGVGGQFIVVSPTAAPKCHNTPTAPSSGYVNGILMSGTTTVNQAAAIVAGNQPFVPGSVSGGGVNTGTVNRPAEYTTTTTVGSSAAVPTAGRAYIGDGTHFTTSVVEMAGAGVCAIGTVMRGTSSTAVPTCTPVGPADVTSGIALTGSGINSSSQPEYAPGTWAFTGIDTPSPSGNLNDYGNCPNTICKVNGGGTDLLWTGLLAPSPLRGGTIKEVCNWGTSNLITLKEQSGSSGATNRYAMGSDYTLRPKQCTNIWYDTVDQRWKLWEGTIRDPYKIRSCTFPFGSVATGAAPLDATDDGRGACRNDTGVDVTLKAVTLKCDGGASTFTPILTGGAGTSIVSAACTCGAAETWVNCALNGTPVLHTFNTLAGDAATCSAAPCSADMNMTTADGTTKQAFLTLIWSLP